MKSWKKRWEIELDNAVPKLNDSVLDAPIPTNDDQIVSNGGDTVAKSRNNKFLPLTAVAVAMICALVACLAILLPRSTSDVFLFEVEINPAISVVTDEEGKVTSVMASNADADVVLSTPGVVDHMIGKDFATAVENYADYAAKLGYLDMDADVCAMRISGCEKGDEILNNAKSALETHFADKGVVMAVICENLSKEEFCNRSGIDGETSKDIAKFIEDNAILYANRLAENLTIGDLQTLYGSVLVDSQMFESIKGLLKANIETLENMLSTAGFEVSLDEIIDSFSYETLVEWGDRLSMFMNIAGIADEDIIKLLHIPETIDDYCNKVFTFIQNECDYRLNKYEEIYNKIRQPLTKEEFNSQIDAIIAEFGSLSEYWESAK